MLNSIAMIPNTERMNFKWQKEISETIYFTGSSEENDAAKFQSSCVDSMEKFQSNRGSICFYGKHIISFTYVNIRNVVKNNILNFKEEVAFSQNYTTMHFFF